VTNTCGPANLRHRDSVIRSFREAGFPGGWITTTARNRAIDRLRREARGRELLSEARGALARAKRKIKAARIPYRVPED
jgi:predicted RNA polymerase sigma factor